jgi:hypothetical protein
MTRKPNLWKLILGLGVIACLFVGTWAKNGVPVTSAKKITPTPLKASTSPGNLPRTLNPMAPLDTVTSVIELDGDISDNPAGAPDDWDTINCDGGTALVKSGVIFDGLGATIFTGGGSKDPEQLGSWKHKNGSVPDKDELINSYAAKYVGQNGDDILAFGADRYSNDGTAFMGFWFFTNSVFATSDGKFRSGPLATDPLASHSLGDVLVLIEFTQGGSVATAKVFEWVGSGGSEQGGTLNDITGTAPAGSVLSDSNASAQVIPGTCSAWQHDPKTGPDGTIQVNSFFEGAINLSAFPALSNACFSSFLAETRSSSSVTATLKDFVLGQLDTCPDISITKVADDTDICAGTPTTYTYTVTNPTTFNLSATVVDDNETPANTADDLDVTSNCATIVGSPQSVTLSPGNTVYQCTRTLSTGTHTNVVKATATFGNFSSTATATETVTVSANPDMSIDNFACNTSGLASTLTATDLNSSGATLSWTRNGAAFAGNVTSINVTLPGVYVVTATTTGGCSDTASRTVGICTTCAP